MTATPDRARAVFDRAAEMTDPAAQAALVDRECAGEPGLRARVEALLRAFAAAGSFLDRPPAALVGAAELPATFGVSMLDALSVGAGPLPRVQLRDPADGPLDRP